MIRRTIVLCRKKEEAYWCVRYYNLHKTREIIVLAPTIESQTILKKNGVPHLKIYDVENFELDQVTASAKYKKNIYKVALETIDSLKIQSKYLNLEIDKINLFDLLVNNFLFIYSDIIHSFNTYKKMLRKWNPDTICIPKNLKEDFYTGSIDSFFSLAVYIKYYFNSSKIKLVEYETSKTRVDLTIFINLIKNAHQVKLLLQSIYYRIFKPQKRKSNLLKPTIVMETGGIISSYYYPLYKLLSNHFNFKLITYKLQLSHKVPLFQRAIDFEDIESYWKDSLVDQLNKHRKILVKEILNLEKLNIRRLKTINNRQLIKAIQHQTVIFLKRNIPRTIKTTLINQIIIDKYNPKLIINTHDPGFSGASFVLPAQKRNIPSLLLLHGLFVETYLPEAFSKYFAVWGQKNYRYFLENSKRNAKNTFAAGFPGLDIYKHFSKYRRPGNQRVTAKNQIKIGLILSSYFPNDSYQARFFEEFFKSISKFNKRISIQFRLHEGFYIKSIDQISKEYQVKIIDRSKSDLIEFIKESDLVICWDTTALVYVMLLGKPMIHTSPIWKKGVITPTQGYNAAWIPKDNIELERIIDHFLKNPKIGLNLLEGQNKFLEDYCGPVDGKSNFRIYSLIKKLI